MVYHWQAAPNVKISGVDDMVLLSKITEDHIVENLKKRYMDNYIFTYIGPVLVSINPFKQMPYFTEKEIDQYQGAAQYENPPHIYALADNMFRNMLIDQENQCVIISGESGAGKTVAAKYIMNYLSCISGGNSTTVQHIKDIILESNPLLESFGNAKTVRNNNSSRFGKYVEIEFSRGGQPTGGKISNFLLEKSRVVSLNQNERSFHIFYQLCAGATEDMKSNLALTQPDYFATLNQSECYKVDGTNDAHDFQETLKAMKVIGLSQSEQNDILRIISALLHMGNIQFQQDGQYAKISDKRILEYPSTLLDIKTSDLGNKLVSRSIEGKWGSSSENIEVTLNTEQAYYTRDALSKAIYSRLFDFLVNRVNKALDLAKTGNAAQSIGILDIYGFEIFQNNGFEQFCINYVNEKLQQIFIELTLKAEQEEYVQEGIRWVPIDYFNNQIVVELIEGKRPPGIFAILDDVCVTMHAITHTADSDFQKKMTKEVKHQHYQTSLEGFIIHHYAGMVTYNVEGFCDRNRDVLFPDLIKLMQNSTSPFIKSLFKEEIKTANKHQRPTTAGSKIRSQANDLINALMKCTPHYVRCIKPNETKKPKDWEEDRVKHQVEYLGLKENVRVRRAGFAYRRPFEKFMHRYAIISKETWPNWRGKDIKDGIHTIMRTGQIDKEQYQLGRTKVFIKAPESLFQLEEIRERHYDKYARILQKAFRKYFAIRQRQKQRDEAAAIFFGKKQRRKYSINRSFVGDYIGLDHRPELLSLINRREKVEFCETVDKYDRRFKSSKRDLFVTNHRIILIGREKVKKGPQKGKIVPVIKRDIPYKDIIKISVSTRQDNFVIFHVRDSFDTLIESIFKTELLTVMNKRYNTMFGQDLNMYFSDQLEFNIKKEGFEWGGRTRSIKFENGISPNAVLKTASKVLNVQIADGLPANSRPQSMTMKSNRRSYNPPPRNSYGANINNNNNTNNRNSRGINNNNNARNNFINSQQQQNQNQRPARPPPPPSEPAPLNQPKYFRLPSLENKTPIQNKSPRKLSNASNDNNVLSVARAGLSGTKRSSISGQDKKKPLPAIEKPRPKPKPGLNLPKCIAIYDYEAQDVDELSLKEGDVVYIVHEHDSGWWRGRKSSLSKEGLFPGNYCEKI